MRSSNHLRLSMLFVIITTLLCGVANAQERSFSLSKNLGLENRFPSVAVSTKTGNVLVVWVRKDDEDISEAKIYAALCVINKYDQCVVKKARLISAAGDICEWHPDAAYNPEDDSYLVVWSTTYGDIKTVKVTKKGRPSKTINSFPASTYSYPVVAYAPADQATAPSAKGGYLLSYANHLQSHWGLYTLPLDSGGAPLGQAKKVSSGYTSEADHPTRIIRDTDGTYLIAHIKKDLKYGDCANVARVRANGSLVKNARVGAADTTDVGIVQLSSELYLAVFTGTGAYTQIMDQLFKNNLKKFKAPFVPYEGEWIYGCCLAKLRKSDYTVQITQQGSYVIFYRLIGSDGNFAGDVTQLWAEGHIIDALRATCLPGRDTVFLTYSVSHATNDNEIMGFIFEAVQ
jgi:hypothetical protein